MEQTKLIPPVQPVGNKFDKMSITELIKIETDILVELSCRDNFAQYKESVDFFIKNKDKLQFLTEIKDYYTLQKSKDGTIFIYFYEGTQCKWSSQLLP